MSPQTDYFSEADAAWDSGDLERALLLFRDGAKSGDSSCQANLGYFYDEGIAVDADKDVALRWYHQAYQQGETHAATNIAIIWKERKEFRRSLWWFHRAVSLGDGDALIEIARIHERGLGVARSHRLAMRYYKRGASHSNITENGLETARNWIVENAP